MMVNNSTNDLDFHVVSEDLDFHVASQDLDFQLVGQDLDFHVDSQDLDFHVVSNYTPIDYECQLNIIFLNYTPND
jgi:hypothetical protein